jgi:hypothetical protein
MLISNEAACPVSSFSLLSRRRLALVELRANPKSVAGVVTQPCTMAVTSIVMNCPAVEAVKLPAGAPIVGIVSSVTADSVQAEVMGESVTDPVALTRLTKMVRVAREIWLADVPAGNVPRSNRSNVVLPLPV